MIVKKPDTEDHYLANLTQAAIAEQKQDEKRKKKLIKSC